MKELLRTVLLKNYNESLRDYLAGIGFSEQEAESYIQLAELSMKIDIQMEQFYERAIPQALKDYPGLSKDLLELLMKDSHNVIELEITYGLINREYMVVASKDRIGLYTIIINNE